MLDIALLVVWQSSEPNHLADPTTVPLMCSAHHLIPPSAPTVTAACVVSSLNANCLQLCHDSFASAQDAKQSPGASTRH